MATYYVKAGGDGTGGTSYDPLSDAWASAYATIAAAASAGAGADDEIRVSDAHQETAAFNLSGGSNSNNPLRLISVTDAGDVAVTSPGATVQIQTSGTAVIQFGGTCYVWGMNFVSNDDVRIISGGVIFNNCRIGVGDEMYCQNEATCICIDCTLVDVEFYPTRDNTSLIAIDCTWAAGSNNPTGTLARLGTGSGGKIEIIGGDYSAYTGAYLVGDGGTGGNPGTITMSGIKIPSGLTAIAEAAGIPDTFEEWNLTSLGIDDQYYAFYVANTRGYVQESLTVYLDATYDGSTGYSAQMVYANVSQAPEFALPLRFKLCDIYNSAAGSKTVTANFLRTDSTTALQDDEFWIEVEYPNSTNYAKRDRDYSTRLASLEGTSPADHTTDSTNTWTGRGATYKQMSCTTGSLSMGVGVVTVWACLAKSNQTVYVDPKVVIA